MIVRVASHRDPAPGRLASGRLAGPGDDDEAPIGDPPDEDGDWDDEDDDEEDEEDEEPLQAAAYCTAASP